MDGKRSTGILGENIAANYLLSLGHRILARNYRCGHLEIDVISLGEDGIHFVEVKTRRPPLQAEPQDSVDALKQRRLARAASYYLNRQKDEFLREAECHFDVIAITIEKGSRNVIYFPDAFYPMYF